MPLHSLMIWPLAAMMAWAVGMVGLLLADVKGWIPPRARRALVWLDVLPSGGYGCPWFRDLLKVFGRKIVYGAWMDRPARNSMGFVRVYREWDHKYDGADAMAHRPIHADMSVAPPWATRRFVRIKE